MSFTPANVREFIKTHYRHFNAAVVVDASEAWCTHLRAGNKMFLTLAGAMSTAELGISLAEMIRQGKVHAITCTGANLEEDVYNLVAHSHYERVPLYRHLTADEEVKLYDLGPLFLSRYREIFDQLYHEDKRLTLRRGGWGFGLGLLGTVAFYGAYAWIAFATIGGAISLGDMTMYLLLFKQGQAAVAAMLSAIGGMYEDNLYLSNLYDYLE